MASAAGSSDDVLEDTHSKLTVAVRVDASGESLLDIVANACVANGMQIKQNTGAQNNRLLYQGLQTRIDCESAQPKARVAAELTLDTALRRVVVLSFYHPEAPKAAMANTTKEALASLNPLSKSRNLGGALSGLAASLKSAMSRTGENARDAVYERIAGQVKTDILRQKLNAGTAREEHRQQRGSGSGGANSVQDDTSLFAESLSKTYTLDPGYRAAMVERLTRVAQSDLDSASEELWARLVRIHEGINHLLNAVQDCLGHVGVYPPPPSHFAGPRPVIRASEDRWPAEVALDPPGSLVELEERYRNWLQARLDGSVKVAMEGVNEIVRRAEKEAAIYRPQLISWLLNSNALLNSDTVKEFRLRCRFRSEVPLANYRCVLVGKGIPTQGTMYLSANYITFSATMASLMERIPVASVIRVEKKTSSVLKVDNAIMITYQPTNEAAAKELVVSVFLHRDEVIATIQALLEFDSITRRQEDIHEPTLFMAEVFENERLYPFVGWSAKLLPTDRPNFSDRSGKVSLAVLESTETPLPHLRALPNTSGASEGGAASTAASSDASGGAGAAPGAAGADEQQWEWEWIDAWHLDQYLYLTTISTSASDAKTGAEGSERTADELSPATERARQGPADPSGSSGATTAPAIEEENGAWIYSIGFVSDKWYRARGNNMLIDVRKRRWVRTCVRRKKGTVGESPMRATTLRIQASQQNTTTTAAGAAKIAPAPPAFNPTMMQSSTAASTSAVGVNLTVPGATSGSGPAASSSSSTLAAAASSTSSNRSSKNPTPQATPQQSSTAAPAAAKSVAPPSFSLADEDDLLGLGDLNDSGTAPAASAPPAATAAAPESASAAAPPVVSPGPREKSIQEILMDDEFDKMLDEAQDAANKSRS